MVARRKKAGGGREALGMVLTTLREVAREIAFRPRRRRIRRAAARMAGDVLTPAGAGGLLPEVARFDARGPNGDHAVFVIMPPAAPPPGGYPVLYVLDGNAWVGIAADALRLQGRFPAQSEIEPLIIVCVGYPDGKDPIHMGRRAYDLLPPHTSASVGDRFMQGAPWHQPGGADDFIEFLSGPLREALARRYPIDPTRQVLCGHSFGGFFSLYTLFTRPRAFQRYAAISPSIWWDGERLMRQADGLIGGLPRDLVSGLLIAVAEREVPGREDICELMPRLAAGMAAQIGAGGPAGLSCTYRLLQGENHQSAFPAVFSAVMRFATARR